MPVSINSMTAGLSAILGVVSLAIGVWAKVDAAIIEKRQGVIKEEQLRQELALNEQRFSLDRFKTALDERAEHRASRDGDRGYSVQVFQMVKDALEGANQKKVQVALAFVATLPDPILRQGLSSAFVNTESLTPTDRDKAQSILQAAAQAEARLVELDKKLGIG